MDAAGIDASLPPGFDAPAASSFLAGVARLQPGNVNGPKARPVDLRNGTVQTGGLTSHRAQSEFWRKTDILRLAVSARLREGGRLEDADVLARCGTETNIAVCVGCQKPRVFRNRCDRSYCPGCQPALAQERRVSIEWWTKQVRQPKHLVLTARNSATITKDYLRTLKDALSKLRRRKLARAWRGGCWSMEVTNEGRGWHVHFHILVDSPWIDTSAVSTVWGELVGQDYAIVAVRSVARTDYLAEVTKYAVKGTDLARWSAADVCSYVAAVDGVRMFGVFGSLYGCRSAWKEFIESLTDQRRQCECGCSHWKIMSESEYHAWLEVGGPTSGRPPTSMSTSDSLLQLECLPLTCEERAIAAARR